MTTAPRIPICCGGRGAAAGGVTRQQSQAFRRRTGAVAAQQRPMLFDAKSIFAGGGRYRGSAEVREDESGAVEQRARQVPSEYRRIALFSTPQPFSTGICGLKSPPTVLN